jgi:threonine synthase
LNHGAGDARNIVCVLTGHGLKDPQVALQQAGGIVGCDPTLEAIEEAVLEG